MKTNIFHLVKPAVWFPSLLIVLIVVACQRENNVVPVEPKSQYLYDMRPTAANLSVLMTGVKGQPMFTKLEQELDLSQVQTLKSEKEDVSVYIIKLKDKDQYYGVKMEGSVASTEILFSRKMKDENNGSIGLLKNGESLIINYINGARSIRDMTEPEYRAHFTKRYHGGTGFCQLEPGEEFGDCFKAETDEFCDSFISCAALATNPSISILIGIACSCDATMPAAKSVL